MIRTIITPVTETVSFNVPKEYIGKKVELIAFTLNDTFELFEDKEMLLTHYASEKTLAKDWLTLEEDNAWKSL